MKVIGVYDSYFLSTAEEMPAVCDKCIHSFEELL